MKFVVVDQAKLDEAIEDAETSPSGAPMVNFLRGLREQPDFDVKVGNNNYMFITLVLATVVGAACNLILLGLNLYFLLP